MSYFTDAMQTLKVEDMSVNETETREYYYNIPNHPDQLSLTIIVVNMKEDKRWHVHSSFFSFYTQYYSQYTEYPCTEVLGSVEERELYNDFCEKLLKHLNNS